MPFEMLASDLSTAEGKQDFADLYTVAIPLKADGQASYLGESGTFESWVAEYPDEADEFLKFCLEHESPYIRHFALVICSEWLAVNPELATEVIEKVLVDNDPTARGDISFVKDLLTDCAYENEWNALGLSRLARIARAYKEATQDPPPGQRPAIGTYDPND